MENVMSIEQLHAMLCNYESSVTSAKLYNGIDYEFITSNILEPGTKYIAADRLNYYYESDINKLAETHYKQIDGIMSAHYDKRMLVRVLTEEHENGRKLYTRLQFV